METHLNLYSPLSLLLSLPTPGLPRSCTVSAEECGWSGLRGDFTKSGQGVLDQGVSVNPSSGVSKYTTKKFEPYQVFSCIKEQKTHKKGFLDHLFMSMCQSFISILLQVKRPTRGQFKDYLLVDTFRGKNHC